MVPLQPAGWAYDETTNRIVLTFVEVPPADHPDPVNFVSSRDYQIELLPRAVDEAPVRQPEEDRIETLETVTDQLVLDSLMAQMGAMGIDMEGL